MPGGLALHQQHVGRIAVKGLAARTALAGNRLQIATRHGQRAVQPARRAAQPQAVLLNPAVLGQVARLAVRLAPGKMLLQLTKQPGMARFAAPLSVALLAYSVGITIYAATRKPAAQPRRAAAAGGAGGMPAGLISVDTDSMGSMMDSMDASDSEAGTMPRCKLPRH